MNLVTQLLHECAPYLPSCENKFRHSLDYWYKCIIMLMTSLGGELQNEVYMYNCRFQKTFSLNNVQYFLGSSFLCVIIF